MFAKCVSRTFAALALAAVLAVLPATGVLAAPAVSADGAISWHESLQERLTAWTDTVLEALRLQPPAERPGEQPDGWAPRSPDGGDTQRHVQGEEGYKLDPDG